jgi:hypothetical protein
MPLAGQRIILRLARCNMSQNNSLQRRIPGLPNAIPKVLSYIFFLILSSKMDLCTVGTRFAEFDPKSRISRKRQAMKRPWAVVGLVAGMTAVLAGALLVMGNLRSLRQETDSAQLARVEALASDWESRIATAHSVFRDEIYRQDMITVLEHPDEWTPWRVEPKLSAIQMNWPPDAGTLCGLIMFSPDATVHSVLGDSSGVSAAIRSLAHSREASIGFIAATDGYPSRIAFCDFPSVTEADSAPGLIVALLDPHSLLTSADTAPERWALLADPQHPLMSSNQHDIVAVVNRATWPLLISRDRGSLRQDDSSVIHFCKVHVPGMSPLLLVSTPPTTKAMYGDWLVGLGLALLVSLNIRRGRTDLTMKTPKHKNVERVERRKQVVAVSHMSTTVGQELAPDPNSPFPVLRVTSEGLIQSFNQAALKACPRIQDTPLLGGVLPSIDAHELPVLLSANSGGFESLFGSVPHHFEVVPIDEGVLLYAHPRSMSQSLEVALEQAQANFNALCAVSPYPILLVDPRNHVIGEVNAAAASLFSTTPAALRGRVLDSLASQPIDLTASRNRFEAETSNGHIACDLRCEMIKVEGVPMVLVSLDVRLLPSETHEDLSPHSVPKEQIENPKARSLVEGPPILVSFNPVVREVARRLLGKAGHSPQVFSTLNDATAWLIAQDCRPEFVTVDISEYPDCSTWLTELRTRTGNVPCMAITDGFADDLPADSVAVVPKPFDYESIIAALNDLGVAVELAQVL